MSFAQDAQNSGPNSAQPSDNHDDWLSRRDARFKIIKDAMAPGAAYSPALAEMIKDFEAHPLAQTPLENMDLLGLFYARTQGIAAVLPAIVMNATLGWYDALRFGSSSGQTEILNEQMLFKEAFVLAGQNKVNEFLAFAKTHQNYIQAQIDSGLALAEKTRNWDDYDRKWPTVFGFEHKLCGLGGGCPSPVEAPQSEWDDLWQQARSRASTYYNPE
jgi:hypothetical protein